MNVTAWGDEQNPGFQAIMGSRSKGFSRFYARQPRLKPLLQSPVRHARRCLRITPMWGRIQIKTSSQHKVDEE
jgi:hypothetical protein